jgi:hypothetical protein
MTPTPLQSSVQIGGEQKMCGEEREQRGRHITDIFLGVLVLGCFDHGVPPFNKRNAYPGCGHILGILLFIKATE